MASITIRNLPDDAKEKLRLNAAKNKRSMEEEARLLLMSGYNGEIFPQKASVKEMQSLKSKSILLIISGGVAAYKALDLIRRLKERGAKVTVVMTKAATEFVTPLAVGSLSGGHVFTDLFQRHEEHDIGHIRLARSADLIIVAPATADRIAKMANGIADDLAGAILLAANSPLLIAPAMNPAMWKHPATQRNIRTLIADDIRMIGPESGEMAESGEAGRGRMSEPLAIVAAAESMLDCRRKPLSGKHIVVTSGPTHEPIDPVRYLANRSSGKQGHAIAAALHHLGAQVTLVSGPVSIPDPDGVETIHVETAIEMLDAVKHALPADAAIFVAAVADWRSAESAAQKIKKQAGQFAPTLEMVENPDILATIGHARNRPKLVIGFAAETNDLIENAKKKLDKKGADFILANDVSVDKEGKSVMGGDYNRISCVSRNAVETWPEMNKEDVAKKLGKKIATFFS
ncbi:bifunctional phosphopantothenoylcysteine decarboxylase/phosphopantothenate--cysteine ligase CoaBC [Bartonella apis]|uniref:bifunctional phosphopantothenoylcysteine decarboxylase/phosphopantothenate--cysteine ligase CoaBC n=1 Tax=Bartonella apis TaxID=1686310 RepID=UPI00242E21DD|nr:bifunctional phosphopantothenoylcysteine decarboxylase/phosphopantothenate--cysteine ligase CoaBC [Bartonella apis]MCT6824085.1 bifunctional phosphopantothenoylcysteine decarboxylase/phosphopantothenate--cysteine ligase CoaBC [Bartonella apis]MCT6860358.1 bifunctional phosphopantothenoylcysteine decarboxylase/phosphopantothenate--cysteine ligase CoaBC [Bartonella apis]